MYMSEMFKDVHQVKYHPKFDRITDHFRLPYKFVPYDLAILELKSNLVWADNLKPACLPRPKDHTKSPYKETLMVRPTSPSLVKTFDSKKA